MSGSKDWNDLDAGGEQPPKQGTKPDLQERLRRRHQNRASQDTGRPTLAGAEGRGFNPESAPTRDSTPGLDDPDANGNFMFPEGKDQTPEVRQTNSGQGDTFDATLNSVLGELDRDEKAKKKSQKPPAEPQPVFQNNFDDEAPQTDPSRLNIPAARGVPGQRPGARQNPAADGAVKDPLQQMFESLKGGRQGYGREGHEGAGDNPMAALFGQGQGQRGGFGLNRLLGMGQDLGEGGQPEMNDNDPLVGLFGGRGQDPLAAMLGGGRGGDESWKRFQNDNNNLFTSLMGQMQDRGRNEDAMVVDNSENRDGDPFSGMPRGSRRRRDDDLLAACGLSRGEDSDSDDDDGNAEGGKPKKNSGRNREDPVKAMLEEMTKGFDGKSSLLATLREAEKKDEEEEAGAKEETRPDVRTSISHGKGMGGMGAVSGLFGGVGGQRGQPEGQGASGEDPMAQMMASMMGGGRGAAGGGNRGEGQQQGDSTNQMENAFAAMMGGGKGKEAQEGGQNPMADLMGSMSEGGRGGEGGGQNPLEKMMETMFGGGGGDGEGGQNSIADLMSSMLGGGKGGGGEGQHPMAEIMSSMFGGGKQGGGEGQNPMADMMSSILGGGRNQADDDKNPLAGQMPSVMGGGRGRGSGGMDPMAALMGGGRGRGGGGIDPMAALMGGGRGGGEMDPMAALMGGGRGRGSEGMDPMAALMGGGRGRGGGGMDPMAALMGGGRGSGGIDQLAALMGGGRGRGSMGRMAELMGGGRGRGSMNPVEALMGGGPYGDSAMQQAAAGLLTGDVDPSHLAGGGPNEQYMRQMMEAAGIKDEEDVNPETADDNQIIQQMLAYESMRAQSSRAPKANPAMNTIIIVDTSGSMTGEPLQQAGLFIAQFLSGLEEIQFEYQLQENVALVTCGSSIAVAQHFTNDYSLIRNATNALYPEGSSRFYIAFTLPIVLLNAGSADTRGLGGVLQLSNHSVCPRVIFISDGVINRDQDVPGQHPRQDDKMTDALQNLCCELAMNTTERTLLKFHCVPVGNANIDFLRSLAETCGGKLVDPKDAKHLSRYLLHQTIVTKLRECGQFQPSKESVTKILKQITAAADADDIRGVFETLEEGEPDLEARDRRVAQQMAEAEQHRGRGRGQPEQGGQGKPGSGMLGASGRGRMSGIPSQEEMKNLDAVQSGMPGLGGMQGGMPGLGAMPGFGGMSGGMPGLGGMLSGMSGLGGMPHLGGMQGGMPGQGRGSFSVPGKMPQGMGGMPGLGALFGQGRGQSSGRMPDPSALFGQAGLSGGKQGAFGKPESGKEQLPSGVQDSGKDKLNRGKRSASNTSPGESSGTASSKSSVPNSKLGKQKLDEQKSQAGACSSDKPRCMGGLGVSEKLGDQEGHGGLMSSGMDPLQVLLSDKKEDDGMSFGMSELHKMLNQPADGSGMGGLDDLRKLLSGGNGGGEGAVNQNQNRNAEGQEYIEIGGGGHRQLGGLRGMGGGRPGAMPEGLMAMLHGFRQGGEGNHGGLPMFGQAGDNINVPGGSPLLAGQGAGGADWGKGNKRSRVMFNNAPPVSFGLDDEGRVRKVELLRGKSGKDDEGDEMMKKLAEMLGVDQNAEDEDDDDVGVGNVNNEDDGALEELLGLQREIGQGQNQNMARMPNISGDQARYFRGNQDEDGDERFQDQDDDDSDTEEVIGGMG